MQDARFQGRHVGCDPESGFTIPRLAEVAECFGLSYQHITYEGTDFTGQIIELDVDPLYAQLNFGPDNALSWITPPVLPALGVAVGLALLAVWLAVRAAAAVGLLVIATGVALGHGAPSDAYYAASLQAWEQGRFVHLHGLAQWLGWLWPYATLAYLVGRLAARGE